MTLAIGARAGAGELRVACFPAAVLIKLELN